MLITIIPLSFIFDFSIILSRMWFDIQITTQTIFLIHIAAIPMHISISIRIKPIVIILICEELINKLILFSFDFKISFFLLFF